MKQLVTVAFIVLGIQSLLAQDLVYKPKIPLLVETPLITNGWLALLSLKINLQIKPSKKITNRVRTIYFKFKFSFTQSNLKFTVPPAIWHRWHQNRSYTFGSLSVEVYPSAGGLTVDILDTKQVNKRK
jgi:curli production assembly/transport component CsgF